MGTKKLVLHYIASSTSLAFHKFIGAMSYGITHYRDPERTLALKTVKQEFSKIHSETTVLEGVEIYQAVKATEHLDGDIAEVGVYKGASASVILRASVARHVHLFDTFSGLPHAEGGFVKGQFSATSESVQQALSHFKGKFSLHKGYFPTETGHHVKDKRFSFVHLDMDVYQGTTQALEFFWPRMITGGVIISHDYPRLDGVVKAFSEFFADKPTPVIPLSGIQCLVVK